MKWILASALSAGLLLPLSLNAKPVVADASYAKVAQYDGRDRRDRRDRGDRRDRRGDKRAVISVKGITIILRDRGYRNISNVYDRGDCYVARARHPRGYKVALELDRYNARVLKITRVGYDKRDRRDRRDGHYENDRKRISKAARKLRRKGFDDIVYRYDTRRHYVFTGFDRRGRKNRLYMNKRYLELDYREIVKRKRRRY